MSNASTKAVLHWKEKLRFEGGAGDRKLVVDSDRTEGCSPMELLLISLAACMSIDVVHILGKMRATPTRVAVEIEGTRADTEPRRFTHVRLKYDVEGAGVRKEDVQRAIDLSREKYCSVLHSLRPDIDMNIDFALKT